MLKVTHWLVALVVLVTGNVAAGNSQELEVSEAWASATIGPTRTSALYLVILNKSNRTERLTGAETPVADSIEFHFNVRDGDVLRMRRVSAIEIPPGENLVMRQGGLHGMLLRLQRPLKDGESLPVSLLFETAGKVDVVTDVRGFGRTRR